MSQIMRNDDYNSTQLEGTVSALNRAHHDSVVEHTEIAPVFSPPFVSKVSTPRCRLEALGCLTCRPLVAHVCLLLQCNSRRENWKQTNCLLGTRE